MKIICVLSILIIIAGLTQAEVIIKKKNGKEITWDNYQEEADKYCTYISYGKVCLNKKDVADIKVITSSFDTINTDNQTSNGPAGGPAPAQGLPPAAQSACYKALMDKRMFYEGYFPCEVTGADMETYYTIGQNSYLCIYKPECGQTRDSSIPRFKIKCSVTLVNGQWVPFSEKTSTY